MGQAPDSGIDYLNQAVVPDALAASFETASGVDASGMILMDAPCRKCSYNVRGLLVSGRCPECGTPIGVSIHGDWIRFSHPDWVGKLYRGVRLIIWGVTVIVIGIIAGLIVGVVAVIGGRFGPLAPVIIMGLALLVGSMLITVGSWLLTAPDPSGLGEDRYGTARMIVRVSLIVGVCDQLLSLMSSIGNVPPAVHLALEIVSAICSLINVIGFLTMLHYLSGIALRLPDLALSKQASFLMRAFGLTLGPIVVLGLIEEVIGRVGAGGGGRGGPATAIGCVTGLFSLATLVFLLTYLRMLSRFAKVFRDQAQYARRVWAEVG